MFLIIDELPNGFGKDRFDRIYRRFKQDGPNYWHLTPVVHEARARSGYKYDFYPIDLNHPDKAIR